MLVYRLEYVETGIGPYNQELPGSLLRKKLLNKHKPDFRPGFAWDGIYTRLMEDFEETQEWYSACDSLINLREWFRGFFRTCLKEGFRVVKYEVPNDCVLYGDSGMQVAFNKSKAKRL